MAAEVTTPRGDAGVAVAELVAAGIVDVPDFPRPGIMFKDLSPLFRDGERFRAIVDAMVGGYDSAGVDVVAGIEARGFVLAAAVAYATGRGVVQVRKAGKLPRATFSSSYQLEYGAATLEIHQDAFPPGARVLVIDDVLATGGTALATLDLVRQAGAEPVGLSVLVELGFLHARERLTGRPVHALLTV